MEQLPLCKCCLLLPCGRSPHTCMLSVTHQWLRAAHHHLSLVSPFLSLLLCSHLSLTSSSSCPFFSCSCFASLLFALLLDPLISSTKNSLFKLTALFSSSFTFLCSLFPLPFFPSACLSFFVYALFLCVALCLYLCLTFPFPSLPPCPFLGYQTIFPAMRLVTPPPFCPLPPSPPSSSCGKAPIREMITLRHSVIWQRRAAAHTHNTRSALYSLLP